MGSKILTSLVIYLLLHHTQKCVLSDPNLTGSSAQDKSSESESSNPSETSVSDVSSPTTPANQNGGSTPATPTARSGGSGSTPSAPSVVPEQKEFTLVILDIESKNTTDQYNYSKSGNIQIWTTKQNYGFRKVFEKKNALNCAGSDKEVWEAEDKKNYVTKVIFDSGSNRLDLTFSDNSTKKYHKTGSFGSKKWTENSNLTEIDTKNDTKTAVNDDGFVEIFSEGDSNPMDSTKFNYTEGENGRKYYNFNSGVTCTEIKEKREKKKIWKYSEGSKEHGYPKSLLVYQEISVIIYFEKGIVMCNKDSDGQWKVRENFEEKKEETKQEGGISEEQQKADEEARKKRASQSSTSTTVTHSASTPTPANGGGGSATPPGSNPSSTPTTPGQDSSSGARK